MPEILNVLRPAKGKALGPLEVSLLQSLRARGSATVRELIDDGRREFAYTTIMTTLDRLYKKNLLNRVLEGKAFRYSPRHTEEELQKAAARNAVLELFDCKAANSLPLSYLVEIISEYDSKLLDDLEQLIERKRLELRALDPKPRRRT